MGYTEFTGELDREGEGGGYTEFTGELDKPESKLDKVKSVVSKGVDAGLSMLTPKRSIADQAQEQSANSGGLAAKQVKGVPIRQDYYNKIVAETPEAPQTPGVAPKPLVKGNIDLNKRPVVKNADGSISTVRSMGFFDGKNEVLVPTVSDDGRIMSDAEARQNYFKTGKHLGKFNSVADSNAYAEQLHNDQATQYGGLEQRVRDAAALDTKAQRNKKLVAGALTSAEPVPEEGGFINSAGRTIGQSIKGVGQIGADYLGASPNNAVKQYGQAVIDANPTAVNSLEDIAAKPGTAVAEGTGNAAPSMAGMLGARAVGQGITALSPLAGPAAPLVAAAGQVVSWLGPAAIAALPSYGGIRDKQILNDPAAEQSAKSKAIAAMGAAAVAGIETAFGPQNWALAAMTKQGRAALAEKFAATTLAGSAAKAGFKGAGIEGSEELAQSPIEQLASGDNPTTPANIKDTLFGGAMGAISGGVLGGGGGMLLGKPIAQTPDNVLKYTAERGGKKASEAAQAELDRREKQGIVNNTPESTPEAVQRIIDTGKDKAREINPDAATASDSIQSSIFEEEQPQVSPDTPNVITARDESGKVIQNLPADNNHSLLPVAKDMAGPGGTVEVRPVADAIAEHATQQTSPDFKSIENRIADAVANKKNDGKDILAASQLYRAAQDAHQRRGYGSSPETTAELNKNAADTFSRLQQATDKLDTSPVAPVSVAKKSNAVEDAAYHYSDGNLGMASNGTFTKDKSRWMTFTPEEATRMAKGGIKPHGAARLGSFVGINSGRRPLSGAIKETGPAAEPIRSAAQWANEMARLRDLKPRPIAKLFGKNGPTPEQKLTYDDSVRKWNSAYRKASAAQKIALEKDNADFAKAQAAKQVTPPASPKEEAKPTPAAKPSEDPSIRPIVESLIKRKAVASQIGRSRSFDTALADAKDLMAGKRVKPARFKVIADAMNADKPTADILMQLYDKALSSHKAALKAAKQEAKGLSVPEVENHIAPLQKAGTKKIKVAASEADLPKNIQDAIKSAGAAGVRGVYYPQTDEVWLVADRLNNADEAIMVALHEARHRGLRKLFGPEVAPVMRQIYGTNKRVRDAANRMMQSTKGMSKEEATEEVLADMALDKTAHELNGWKRLVQFIQKWLADHGIKLKFTDAMVESLVAGAETEGIAATPPTEAPAFKKWFGNSKVVDEDGKPLVVYHGTSNDIKEFSVGKNGTSATGNVTAVWGSFFTPSAGEASRYTTVFHKEGQNILPVHLSLQNPYEMTRYEWDQHAMKTFRGMPQDQAVEEERAFRSELESQGYDGIIVKGRGFNAEYIAFKPEQIKSAIGNNGQFDPTNPDIRFSRAGQNASWDAPEPSKIDNLIYTLQNKHVDLKRVVESIKKTGAQLAEQWNTYLQEELFHGRAAKRTQDFVNRELKPIIMGMKLRGQTVDELDKYLHARHAEEANKLIAQRDPNMPDGGSGMTTQDAKDYLANLPADKRQALDNTAKQVDAVIAKTRNTYLSYGLIDQETADSWENMFKHYVPLMREDNDGGMGIGQGFSIKGKESKHRTGSKRKVVDILANIALQRERAIVRGEKNRVAVSLAGLAKLNPNPDFWTFENVPQRHYNEKTGLVEERADPLYKDRKNVVVAKIKDSKGKIIERAVVFNEQDDRAMRMAQAMKNLDATQLEGLFGVSASITRYFAAINTQYNPVFGVVNLIRDLQASLLNLSSTEIAGHKAQVLKNIIPAIGAIYSSTRGTRKGNLANSPMANLWDELQNEGGMTGYRDLFRTSEDRANAIKHELDPTAWMNNGLGKIFTAGGTLKVPLAVAQKKAKWIFDWLSDYNQTLEGAMRLAVYKVAIDNGISKQRAASIGKNISVNFNRKGQSGQQAGALYAFFNAAMQGTARMGETMTTMENGDPKTLRFNKAGKTIIAGGISIGVIQALALSAAGFDDDEPPEFVRERSLIIPIGDKKYITIPMPLGFHAIPNIGRLSTEFALGGFKKPADYTTKLFSVFAEAFNPIGNAGMSLQTIAPTAIDPLAALAENRDWTGKPIYKEDFSKLSPTPGFTRFKDTASDPAKWIAEAINTISGGNKYVPGTVSPTADQIDYLVGQITGGVGRETGKAQQSIKAAYTGEDLPPHKIPLVGRFYGSSENQSSQGNAFYSNLKRINEVEAELEGRHKDKLPLDEFKAENPEYRLVKLADMVQRAVSKQRKIKSDLITHDAPRDQVKAVDEKITKLMAGFNGRVKELKQSQQAVH